MPETATANSDKFVFPTNCTPRWRAMARHFASCFAGGLCLARNSEPAVVTTPFMSIKSFTASRNFGLLGSGGQYSMKARSAVGLCGRTLGMAQPLRQLANKHASGTTRATTSLRVAMPKTLPRLDIIPPTKQHSGNHANEKTVLANENQY